MKTRVLGLAVLTSLSCETREDGGVSPSYQDVAYGNGVFVAAGSVDDPASLWTRGVLMTSTDGRTWTPRVTDAPTIFWSVAFGEGRFVAVGTEVVNGERRGSTYWSSDGLTWQRSTPELALSRVAWGNGLFVGFGFALGSDAAGMFHSRDGASWISVPVEGAAPVTENITFAGGKFVSTAEHMAEVTTSVDGVTWERFPLDESVSLRWIAPDGDHFVGGLEDVCGGDGCGYQAVRGAVRSADGVTWPAAFRHEAETPTDFAAFGGQRIVSTWGGLLRDSGGDAWVPIDLPDGSSFDAIIGGENGFVAVGSGSFAFSQDGAAWTVYLAPTLPAP